MHCLDLLRGRSGTDMPQPVIWNGWKGLQKGHQGFTNTVSNTLCLSSDEILRNDEDSKVWQDAVSKSGAKYNLSYEIVSAEAFGPRIAGSAYFNISAVDCKGFSTWLKNNAVLLDVTKMLNAC